jgi:hypothetical protein
MLPVIWAIFAVLAVGGFLMIAAYWLDVQDWFDDTAPTGIYTAVHALSLHVALPIYAFAGGAGWPRFLRAASIVPLLAVALFLGFVFGAFS